MSTLEVVTAVAESVGALGTAGALVLGFRIMRADRWDRLVEQARQVHISEFWQNDEAHYVLRNGSAEPIGSPWIWLVPATRWDRWSAALRGHRRPRRPQLPWAHSAPFVELSVGGDLPAGETARIPIPRGTMGPQDGIEVHRLRRYVTFHDNRGEMWVLDFHSHKLWRGERAWIRIQRRHQAALRAYIERRRGKPLTQT